MILLREGDGPIRRPSPAVLRHGLEIGLVAVLAKRAFGRMSFEGRLVRLLPAASALVILAVGIGITVNALPEVL